MRVVGVPTARSVRMCSWVSVSAIDARVWRAMPAAEVIAIVSTGSTSDLNHASGFDGERHEAGRRQQSQLHGEDVDQEDADPEGGQREQDAGEGGDEAVRRHRRGRRR